METLKSMSRVISDMSSTMKGSKGDRLENLCLTNSREFAIFIKSKAEEEVCNDGLVCSSLIPYRKVGSETSVACWICAFAHEQQP